MPWPDIQTIADVGCAVAVFYARHPEARRNKVNVLIEALRGSALDLDTLASRPTDGVREEAVPRPSPTPQASAPDY